MTYNSENKLSNSLLSASFEEGHECAWKRVVSRQCKMSKLRVHAHTDTNICQETFFFFPLSQCGNAETSVLAFDSLPFTVMDFTIAFSSSYWNINVCLHRTSPPPLLVTDSDLMSFKIKTEWTVSGKKLLYKYFYRKHWKESIWNL